MNPWIGVALISIGVAADIALTLTHNQVSSLIPSIIVAGVGVVQAYAHAKAQAAASSASTGNGPGSGDH